MAKTKQSDVWVKPIKFIGNGYIDLICACSDAGAGGIRAGTGMELVAEAGEFGIYTTAQPDWAHMTVAEDIVDDDRYFLGRKKGASIRHNQKLAGAYGIGDAVYKTGGGTWTIADHDVAASLLGEVGIVCGPADRITATVIKDMDDALTATEPVDICI
jgi:hypothetical protein